MMVPVVVVLLAGTDGGGGSGVGGADGAGAGSGGGAADAGSVHFIESGLTDFFISVPAKRKSLLMPLVSFPKSSLFGR